MKKITLYILILLSPCFAWCASFSGMEEVGIYQNLALYRLDAADYPDQKRIRHELPPIKEFPKLSEQKVIDLLGNLEYRKETIFGTKIRRVFYYEELKEAAHRIAEGFKTIGSKYRLVIVSRYDPDRSVLSHMERVTALVWMDEAGLNVVFGEIRTEIPFDDYFGNEEEWRQIPQISMNRSYRDLSLLPSSDYTFKRVSGRLHETWIIFPEAKLATIIYRPETAAGVPDRSRLTDRLGELKRAHDAGLISDEQYEQKKAEILDNY